VIAARIPDVLDVKRYIRRLSENTQSVIAFDDLFRDVIKSPISQLETKQPPAGFAGSSFLEQPPATRMVVANNRHTNRVINFFMLHSPPFR
jgi:hypothetical protein